MRLEKINDKQIRCTLNSSDFTDREMNLGELTYGSEKARNLFREMLQQAAYELDFEAEDTPLMIEAIPLAEDSVMLLITKVEDPEELDTRFAKFAPTNIEEISLDDTDLNENTRSLFERADEIIDMFQSLEETDEKSSTDENTAPNAEQKTKDILKIYRFRTLDELTKAAKVLDGIYDGRNSLYKDEKLNQYFLTLHITDHTPETFNSVCNILSEYSDTVKNAPGLEAYYQEHLYVIVLDKAIQVFKKL